MAIKGCNWFVAQFKPNSYLIANENLKRQGIQTFLPLVETTKRRSTTYITKLEPLFPGYIFVAFDLEKFRWTRVNNTMGVNRIVSQNNMPQPISHSFISCLKKRCDSKGKLLSGNDLRIGKKVEIINGPFAKMIGTVETINPDARITLLFDIMGQTTRTLVKSMHLKNVN